MQKQTIKIAMHGGEFKEVNGYRFDITPTGFDVAVPALVHRPVGSICSSAGWAVSDIDTGCLMVRSCRSIHGALSAAEAKLAHCGEITYAWSK